MAFIVDANNWIVADDFDVDFPEFEHRTEWFDASRYCTSDTSDE